jgi:PAS domain S-box-containing protein
MLAILGVLLATTIAGGGFVVYEQRSADDLVRIAGLIVTFTAILLVVLGLVLVRFEQLRSTHDELERANAQMRSVLEASGDAFVSMDASGQISAWNAQAESTFGWSRTEAIGRTVADTIVPAEHREAHIQGLRRFLETGDGSILNQRIDITAVHRDGHPLPVELVIWPVASGECHTFNAFVHAITERKRTDAELNAAHAPQRLVPLSYGLTLLGRGSPSCPPATQAPPIENTVGCEGGRLRRVAHERKRGPR